MWLSKLNDMSVGPLWVLRNRAPMQSPTQPAAHSSDACSVCGQPWCAPAADAAGVLVVLPAAVEDPVQQTLFQNCLRVAGLDQAAQFDLHGACSSSPEAALQALQLQMTTSATHTVIVFGDAAAQRIQPEFGRGQVHLYQDARVIVTWHPEQMLADPALKAEVWSDLCRAAYDA